MKLETIVTRSHTYFPRYVFELSGVMIIAVLYGWPVWLLWFWSYGTRLKTAVYIPVNNETFKFLFY